jgi:KaiC/GvpD/RAD55 family RecA-like ATPase
MDRIKTGVPGMDELLSGGIPKGRTILVSGSCGTGKTIFVSQFIQEGVKESENCVYVTFEQMKDKLNEDLREIGIDFVKMEKDGKLSIVGGPIGHVKYFKEKTRADMFDISNEIKDIIKEKKAKRVVIDSVNLFTMLFETDMERRKAMAELTSMLERLDCTTLMTCEVREGTKDISWYGFEEFVVDGVICLYRIFFENTFERAIAVVKMRGIDHSHSTKTVQIGKGGMQVYPDQEPFHETK